MPNLDLLRGGNIPTLYIDHNTNTAVQVREAFAAALAEDLLANIADVSCAYELLSDSVQFMIERRSDGMKVMLPVGRQYLYDAAPSTAVAALKSDPEAFARLILFLA